MNKVILALLVMLMIGVQSCNKVDTGAMLEGDYWVKKHYKSTNGVYTLYKSYNISSPVYYFVQSRRAALEKINITQAFEADTTVINGINLTLGGGGTRLNYNQDSVIIYGLEKQGDLTYVRFNQRTNTGDSIIAERKL